MAVEAVTNAGGFTNEILSKNFVAVSKEFQNVAQWQRHVEEHISELYDMVQVAGNAIKQLQKPKGMKTKHKVILGIVAGVYVGRKMMTRDFNENLEKIRREAKEQFDKSVEALKQESKNVAASGVDQRDN